MKIIGQAMHILNPALVQALENRDRAAAARMAQEQVTAGADALDVNLGQVRQFGRLTSWLIETVQEAAEVPLLLSQHVLSQPQVLQVHKGRATINAVTADPDDLRRAMEIVGPFQTDLTVLLVSSQLTPTDVDGRLRLATQVLDIAAEVGFSPERLYLDPVIACRTDPTAWTLTAGLPDIETLATSIRLLGDLAAPRLRTLTGLSNASVCLPPSRRSSFHCFLLPLLAEAGLDAVIMNCRDKVLMDAALSLKAPQAMAA
jgi:5-methyltetrahydrofolate--homocysteine methyltransferase